MLLENSYWKRPFLIIDFPTGLFGSATSYAEIIKKVGFMGKWKASDVRAYNIFSNLAGCGG